MLRELFGVQPDFRLSGTRFTSIAALCLGLVFASGTPARSQEAAATPDSATLAYTTFEVPGAGTGENQGTAALSINASGEITGIYIDANGLLHGFLRPASGSPITAFDVQVSGLGKVLATIPTAINTAGEITGSYADGNGVYHGFLRAANGTFTFFDARNAGTTEHRGTYPIAINAVGIVAGTYTDDSAVYHGFVRAGDGTITPVNVSGEGTAPYSDQGTFADCIDTAGDVAGFYNDADGVSHGFVRAPGTGAITTFDDPYAGGGHSKLAVGTNPTGIDTAEDIAGTYTDVNGARHGFLRAANGAITTIDVPGAAVGTYDTTFPFGINTVGAITGAYANASGVHGFVRAVNATFTTLDAPGAGLSSCTSKGISSIVCGTVGVAVNTAGVVAGTYVNADAVLHGFVYSPAAPPPVPTTTSLASSLNPSVYLEPVTFSAKVTSSNGAPPNLEDVKFYGGAAYIGTGTLGGGSASTTTTVLPVGKDSITASYAGDGTFGGSTSAALSQVVNKANSFTALTANPNPSSFVQSVTLKATVTGQFGGTPSGTVTFSNGTKKIGTATLSKGAASLSTATLPVGADSITAVYSGDTNFGASTSNTVKQMVNQASTTTTLTSSLNPSKSGQSVTFTATVTGQFGGSPSGSVAFKNGTKLLKTVTLISGVATYTTTTLTSGTHSITAAYSGDTNFKVSSASLSQKVN